MRNKTIVITFFLISYIAYGTTQSSSQHITAYEHCLALARVTQAGNYNPRTNAAKTFNNLQCKNILAQYHDRAPVDEIQLEVDQAIAVADIQENNNQDLLTRCLTMSRTLNAFDNNLRTQSAQAFIDEQCRNELVKQYDIHPIESIELLAQKIIALHKVQQISTRQKAS